MAVRPASALALMTLLAFASPARAEPPGAVSPSDRRFESLLSAALKAPAKTDWKALRKAFSETSMYNPYNASWHKEIGQVIEQLKGENYKQAATLLGPLIERDRYMRLETHGLALRVYEKLGDKEKLALHRAFLEGISGTLFVPGTGLSTEKPIEVLFVDEEYLFIGSLEMKVKKQSLVEREGHKFDVLTVEEPGQEGEREFYFKIDMPMRALDRSLGKLLENATPEKP
jgi:hypothetical protein